MTTSAVKSRPADRFLRVALKVDAVASGISGAGLLGTPQMHQDIYGVPKAVAVPLGAFLLLFAATVWFTSSRKTVDSRWVVAIMAINLGWVLASVTVIVADLMPLTTLGIGFVALQAAAVAVFTELEFVGLRRIRRQ